jgi:hypothetical protein
MLSSKLQEKTLSLENHRFRNNFSFLNTRLKPILFKVAQRSSTFQKKISIEVELLGLIFNQKKITIFSKTSIFSRRVREISNTRLKFYNWSSTLDLWYYHVLDNFTNYNQILAVSKKNT